MGPSYAHSPVVADPTHFQMLAQARDTFKARRPYTDLSGTIIDSGVHTVSTHSRMAPKEPGMNKTMSSLMGCVLA